MLFFLFINYQLFVQNYIWKGVGTTRDDRNLNDLHQIYIHMTDANLTFLKDLESKHNPPDNKNPLKQGYLTDPWFKKSPEDLKVCLYVK